MMFRMEESRKDQKISPNFRGKLSKFYSLHQHVILNSLKIILTVLSFIWGYFHVYIPASEYRQLDFQIYLLIYNHPIEYWYSSSSLFYYSPLFYILFYPFYLMGYNYFVWIGIIFYLFGIIQTMRKLEFLFSLAVIHIITFQFWSFMLYGNVDLYFFGLFVLLWDWPKSDGIKGFVLGICLFKGSVLYILPFFLYHIKNRRQFIMGIILGGVLNYAYFLFDPQLIPLFFDHIQMQNHPDGLKYLTGIHYPWLWVIVVLAIQEFFNKRADPYYGRRIITLRSSTARD